jgi:methyltransferase (TIGR00027 family)
MRENNPSQTASLVAFLRALADGGYTSAKGFHDPTARQLLPWMWSSLLKGTEWRLRQIPAARRIRIEAAVDTLGLRTLIIDAHVKEAIAHGARQLVILGAGLDGRPYRMKELAGVRVFEVDHPATQRYKRSQVDKLKPLGESLTFVSVNFEKDSLRDALLTNGFRPEQQTIWIWEGVVMYLSEAAFRETLKTMAGLSAPGSRMVMNYAAPAPGGSTLNLLFRWWGEPQVDARTPEQVATAMAAAGFLASQDTGMKEWAERFGARIPRSPRLNRLRVVLGKVPETSKA